MRPWFIVVVIVAMLAAGAFNHGKAQTVDPTKTYTWALQNRGACSPPKSGTTFKPTCTINYITIDGPGETIALPDFLPANTSTSSIKFVLSYTGAFAPSFAAGYRWPGRTTPPQCDANHVNQCFSAAADKEDWMYCESKDQANIGCGPPMTDVGLPAVAHVQGGLGTEVASGTSATAKPAAAIGAGNTILGAVFYGSSAAALSSCGDGTNTYPLGKAAASGTWRIALFGQSGLAATAAAPTITCKFSSTVSYAQVIYDEYTASAIDVSSAQAQTKPGTGADAVSSGSVTTTVPGLVWGVDGNVSSYVTTAPGTGFTMLWKQSQNGADWSPITEQKLSTPGTNAATFTDSTNGGGGNLYLTGMVGIH